MFLRHFAVTLSILVFLCQAPLERAGKMWDRHGQLSACASLHCQDHQKRSFMDRKEEIFCLETPYRSQNSLCSPDPTLWMPFTLCTAADDGLLELFPTGPWAVPLAPSVSFIHLKPERLETGKPHRSSYITCSPLSAAFCWVENSSSLLLGDFVPILAWLTPPAPHPSRDHRGHFSFLCLH